MYRLVFENRAEPREPFATTEPLLVIGRDSTCHLSLLENGVSDRHASIERRDDGYYVRDLDSANGIRVNGQAVHEQRLTTGDELELGSVRLFFEIVHAPARRRLTTDPLQLASAGIVTASILAQLAVLGWIFSHPRQRDMPLDSGNKPRTDQAANVSAAAQETLRPADSLPALAATPPATPAAPRPHTTEPSVLNRLIRILRVDRTDSGNVTTLGIAVRAQVGERELDTTATAINVQFFSRDSAGNPVAPGEPVWLRIPRWENFSTQTFTVPFRGPASQLAGYIVRTYYRRQLQDVAAVPPTLLSAASEPAP
jgi:pSer/pThr/pTyr-binding forkhead associated (FHA) protein